MLGALVIDSRGTPERLPIFDSPVEGKHTEGLHRGTWWFDPQQTVKKTVYLSQRDRVVDIYSNDDESCEFDWDHQMSAWDLNDGQTQYEKLSTLRSNLPPGIRNASIHMQYTGSNHKNLGTWSIIRNSLHPVRLFGVQSSRSTYLVWSTEDIVNSLRILSPDTYSIFRFSHSWQTFLNTQAICGKWWKWNTKFGPNTLKMFNALEVMLTKVR